jgi:streptogramin lyase
MLHHSLKSMFAILAGASLLTGTVRALEITSTGQVHLPGGTAVAGAMVTLTDAHGTSVTGYSDQAGRWSVQASALTEPVSLRIRAGSAYADHEQPLGPEILQPLAVQLQRLTQVEDISERLTASAHAASIRWQSAGAQADFISQCHFCHQIGNALTRTVKSEDQWRDTIRRMEGYGALITWKNEQVFAETLAESFQGEPLAQVQTVSMHPELPRARLREWAFGGPTNYVHDVELGPDGKLYGVDMSADHLWILDPATNQIESVDWPANDLPLGGMFAGAVAPLGTFEAHHGPHSIVHGPDGKLYTTNSLAAEIGIFDPQTRQTEFVPTGADTIYPHTLRFDAKGMLWFTFALSNQVGRMDPVTRKITLIDLPANGFWRWLTDAMLPTVLEVASWFGKEDMHITLSHHKLSGEGRQILNLPYGIDINPVDGSVWYSKLYANRIGRIDPQTLVIEEYETPFPAPRRLRFAKDGTLWIPSFDSGVLMKFDAGQRAFLKHYPLPVLAENEYETPYAVGIEPSTQQVWIAANMSDRILRFDPQSETFVAYPSPTRVTFMRDFIFTPDGEVCTSNANLPAGAIEGGRPKFMCLKP